MMKRTNLIHYIYVAAALLLATACTDESGSGDALPGKPSADGFVKLAICLPAEDGGTKAENDRFDDGRGYEYAVGDALLAFFEGDGSTPDRDATLLRADAIDLGGWNLETATGNITATRTLVAEAPQPGKGKQLYVLAVLNPGNLFDLTAEGGLRVDGRTVRTLPDLQQAVARTTTELVGGPSHDRFLMTNAPVADRPSTAPGGFTPQVRTLVPARFYTATPADADSPDRLYVERAVAKVEVAAGDGRDAAADGSISIPVSGHTGHSVTFTSWKLDVVNRRLKPVRDVSPYATWATYANPAGAATRVNRFFGTAAGPYRVYWAVDPNYDDAAALPVNAAYQAKEFYRASEADAASYPFYVKGQGSVAYCPENTMVAAQMREGLMTAVVLEGIYRIAGNSDTHGDVFTMGQTGAIYSTAMLEAAVNKVLGLSGSNAYRFVRGTAAEGAEIRTVAQYAGRFRTAGSGTAMTAAHAEKLIASRYVGTIRFFNGGKTFYRTRPVQHFGAYYTPGSSTAEADALGRYGVVRNNWYVVQVDRVTSPGYPVIPGLDEPDEPDQPGGPDEPGGPDNPDPPVDPDPDPDPDPQEKEYGIAVSILVRPWTVRYQEIEF